MPLQRLWQSLRCGLLKNHPKSLHTGQSDSIIAAFSGIGTASYLNSHELIAKFWSRDSFYGLTEARASNSFP